MSKKLQDLLTIPTPKKKRSGTRRIKKWQWFDDENYDPISKHWTKQEAMNNAPTEPGTYYLNFGSNHSFITIETLIIK